MKQLIEKFRKMIIMRKLDKIFNSIKDDEEEIYDTNGKLIKTIDHQFGVITEYHYNENGVLIYTIDSDDCYTEYYPNGNIKYCRDDYHESWQNENGDTTKIIFTE